MTTERQLLAAVWLTLFVLFIGVALALLLRRLTGAFDLAPSGWVVVGMSAVCVVIVAALRWPMATVGLVSRDRAPSTQYSVLRSWRSQVASDSRFAIVLAHCNFVMPGLAAICLLGALTLAGTSTGAIVAAWFLLVAGEAVGWLALHRVTRPRSTEPHPIAEHRDEGLVEGDAAEAEIPAGLVQQVTRVREGDRESIHALVQAEVAAGDRTAVVHLAFCPPLEATPELTAHAMEVEDVEVKVTQAETFGARMEVRQQSTASEPRNVIIELLGIAKVGGNTDLH